MILTHTTKLLARKRAPNVNFTWTRHVTAPGTTQARFPFKRNRLRWQAANHGCHCFDRAFLLAGACVCCVKISQNKHNRQPIGMLGRSSGNCDWLLANASDCVWMETGLQQHSTVLTRCNSITAHTVHYSSDRDTAVRRRAATPRHCLLPVSS